MTISWYDFIVGISVPKEVYFQLLKTYNYQVVSKIIEESKKKEVESKLEAEEKGTKYEEGKEFQYWDEFDDINEIYGIDIKVGITIHGYEQTHDQKEREVVIGVLMGRLIANNDYGQDEEEVPIVGDHLDIDEIIKNKEVVQEHLKAFPELKEYKIGVYYLSNDCSCCS